MDDLDLGATIKGFSAGQKIFNRYTLQRILGRGGMGVVWLARDEELRREVALKFLPEMLANDPVAISDMKREVRRAIDLAHPHIIKTNDFLTDGRTTAVSMEHVSGGTLSVARLVQPGQVFPTEALASWVEQLCAALDYAHFEAEVVHRDLKPSNLMLDAKGRLKVVDFGIAASISESVTRVSKQAGSSGTPVYMSPQQMMGEEPTPADDVYAVGATLFELLTGKPPFHAGNIVLQVQSKPAPRLNDRRNALTLPPVPEEWDQAIAACLAKDPKDRPQSAGELAARLGLNAKDTPRSRPHAQPGGDPAVSARAAEPAALAAVGSPPTGRAGAPRRFAKIGVGAAIAVAVLLAVFGIVQFNRSRAEELAAAADGPPNEKPRPPVAGAPWTNSLGQKFVPVPNTDVLFGVWETRQRDYEAFVRATGKGRSGGGDRRRGDHPATFVSWNDAWAFCVWLTDKEHSEGVLLPSQSYRLPFDWEWSVAVGLQEDRQASLASKNSATKGVYSWGQQWPPPPEAGNLGYHLKKDSNPESTRVGSFPANRFGLYDLAGNVEEWCGDVLPNSQISRGNSFTAAGYAGVNKNNDELLSSHRSLTYNPNYYSQTTGFRVVVDTGPIQPPSGSLSP